MPLNCEGLFQGGRQLLRELARDDGVGTGEDDAELIAPEAADQVLTAEARLDARAKLLEKLVAGNMAKGVVDLLEVIEIEDQQRGANVGAADEFL